MTLIELIELWDAQKIPHDAPIAINIYDGPGLDYEITRVKRGKHNVSEGSRQCGVISIEETNESMQRRYRRRRYNTGGDDE